MTHFLSLFIDVEKKNPDTSKGRNPSSEGKASLPLNSDSCELIHPARTIQIVLTGPFFFKLAGIVNYPWSLQFENECFPRIGGDLAILLITE